MTTLAEKKKSLEKAFEQKSSAPIIDILLAIESAAVNADQVKSTKIGPLVLEIKKWADSKSEAEVSSISKKVLLHLKKTTLGKTTSVLHERSISVSSMADHVSAQSVNSAEASLSLRIKTAAVAREEEEDSSLLGPQRCKIVELFFTHFKDHCSNEEMARELARRVEASVFKEFPIDTKTKEYNSKVRSLVFNIKRNASLRSNLISGSLSCNILVHLTPDQLATEELKQQRKVIEHADAEKRRLDWIEEHIGEIKEDLGIDPSNVWEYEKEEVSDND